MRGRRSSPLPNRTKARGTSSTPSMPTSTADCRVREAGQDLGTRERHGHRRLPTCWPDHGDAGVEDAATSRARQRRTSRRISTARCRGGRSCRVATKAMRTASRESANSAGSLSCGPIPRHACAAGTHGGSGVPVRRAAGAGRLLRVERSGPAFGLPPHVDADVGRDAVQPRPAGSSGPRGCRCDSRPAPSSPAPRRRPRTPSPGSGGSDPSAPGGAASSASSRVPAPVGHPGASVSVPTGWPPLTTRPPGC